MYDGFTFGTVSGIYNPWSVLNYIRRKELKEWWVNSSDNQLVGKLLRGASIPLQRDLEKLLNGESIQAKVEESIVFDALQKRKDAVWHLLLESGYLKPLGHDGKIYDLTLTNREVLGMFQSLVSDWFDEDESMSMFIQSMLDGDVVAMNREIKKIADNIFSVFDSAKEESKKGARRKDPELFYHGFMLGILSQERNVMGKFLVFSNRESGRGRFDVMLEPRDPAKDYGYILEFKVYSSADKSLGETVARAIEQIDERHYDRELLKRGVPSERIRKYGIAFQGLDILIDDRNGAGRREREACIAEGREPFGNGFQ